MTGTRVVVEGADTFRTTCGLAARRIQDMSDPMRGTALYVSTRGRANAPVLTGRLASSLRASSDSESASVESGLAYARRTHYGYARYHQAPQPFLYDAVRTGERTILSLHEARVEQVLDGIHGA